MKRNMTMHQPDARVIRLERNDDVAILRQKHHVTPWGIIKLQIQFSGVVITMLGLLQDGEIVPV